MERILKQLNQWTDDAKNPKRKNTTGAIAITQFLNAHTEPYKKWGQGFKTQVLQVCDLLPWTNGAGVLAASSLPTVDNAEAMIENRGKMMVAEVRRMADELRRYRETWNFDDMARCLVWIVSNLDRFVASGDAQSRFFEGSGIEKVMSGIRFTDVGEMRAALQHVEKVFSSTIARMDETHDRSVVLDIWDVVRKAREALATAPEITEVEVLREEARELRAFINGLGGIVRIENAADHKLSLNLAITLLENDYKIVTGLLNQVLVVVDSPSVDDPLIPKLEGVLPSPVKRVQVAVDRLRTHTTLLHLNEELRGWKESALVVLNGINLQAIAREMGLILGQDVGPRILPFIKKAARPISERLAEKFHETYERLAPAHGYDTRAFTAKPWDQIPNDSPNKRLMIAVCKEIFG